MMDINLQVGDVILTEGHFPMVCTKVPVDDFENETVCFLYWDGCVDEVNYLYAAEGFYNDFYKIVGHINIEAFLKEVQDAARNNS